ncbi:fas apoptotic inhibitory molecule 1-like [Lineus longissimus]|uniref:fas apoptotic inhibitory molecule 1-like n=1 Tax=Lineus longissimus TaxID=88925 RepID=UPI002B4FAB19
MSVLLGAVRDKQKMKKKLKAEKMKKSKSSGATSPSPTTSQSYIPSATTKVWNWELNGSAVSIALQKDTMDVWCNDELMDVTSNFSDEGSELDFCLFEHKARIRICSGGSSKDGMSHTLTVDGAVIPEAKAKH